MLNNKAPLFGLHHVAISTPDLKRSVQFYTSVLGARLEREGGWVRGNRAMDQRFILTDCAAKICLLNIQGHFLEIFQFDHVEDTAMRPEAWRPGFTHFALQVEDCRKTYEELSVLGVDFVAEPLTMPSGASFFYARDPDGNIIEFLDVPEGADFPSIL